MRKTRFRVINKLFESLICIFSNLNFFLEDEN